MFIDQPFREPDPRSFFITREIGIDAGHRVTNHHSKCRSVHGHRYTIQATVKGELADEGSTEGMAGGMDFGFLKDEMMKHIDADCDHALILWREDPLVRQLLINPLSWFRNTQGEDYSTAPEKETYCGKLYIMDCVPTAENLAAHWFIRLIVPVKLRTNNQAALYRVRVWETPNCFADAYQSSV